MEKTRKPQILILCGPLRALILVASTHRHDIIAAKRKIVKTGCVTVPSGHVHGVAANDVGRGAHLDASLAGRPFEKRHFQFDCSARRNHARRQKIDAARADVAGDQCNGKRFGLLSHAKEPHRQRQRGARCAAAILNHTYGVCGNAREPARARFTGQR